MNRQELEKQALDAIAGRKAQAAVAKPKMSAMAKLSIWLWMVAVVVIGSLAGYVYIQK